MQLWLLDGNLHRICASVIRTAGIPLLGILLLTFSGFIGLLWA